MTTSLIPRRGLAAIVVAVVLLAGAAGATAYLVARLKQDQNWVVHTLEVENRLARISALLHDAETSQRGYLITENPALLAGFDRAHALVAPALDNLASAIADNPTQLKSMEELRPAVADWLAFIAGMADLQRDGRRDEAMAAMRKGPGKALQERAKAVLDSMLRKEQGLLSIRKTASRQTFVWTLAMAGVGLVGAAILLLLVVQDARRKMRELNAANLSLQAAIAATARESDMRRMAEEQFRQAQKMEAVGQLTGGIAHDFNNMLAIIIGSLNLLQRRIERGDFDVRRFVDAALEGAERAATLTNRLLAFSRRQPLAPSVTDANALLARMSELLHRVLGENVRLETVQGAGLWTTKVDAGQLEHAILNLSVNARDAMPDGGKLTIETYNASLDEAYAKTNVEATPGQYVVVAVSDTGEGMTREVAARAFDPFFTTKPVGKGTGLGLSQVYGFVKQSGGHIKIYSEPGEGTTIKIYLARHTGAEQAAEATKPSDAADATAKAGEIVLVVEDEERVRRIAVETLRDLGYLVVHARDGAEALAKATGLDRINLLLTDIVMPDMNGRKLAEAMTQKFPGAPVLYMTGYTRNAVIHDGKLDPGVNFLAKPFTIAQLAAKARAVIDAG